MGKTERRKVLFKEGENSLDYSSKIAIVYKVVEDPLIKQQIKNVYKGDARAQRALTNEHEFFYVDESGLIRFKGMVYLLELIRKQFVRELHKALTTGHLGIEKTRDKVAKHYYFPLIKRMVERVIKECNICQCTKTVHRVPYGQLMSPSTLKEP